MPQSKNLHGQLEILLPTTAFKATYLFIDHTAFKAIFVEAMPPVDIMGLQTTYGQFPLSPTTLQKKNPPRGRPQT